MSRNLGHLDRLIRLMVGVGLVMGGVFNGGWGWLAALVGLVLVITGMSGNCFIYSILDWSTYTPSRGAGASES